MNNEARNRSSAPDRDLIRSEPPHELESWSEALGITHEELMEAVRAVGNSTVAVKEHLGRARRLHPYLPYV